jgi:hypothetical protein
MRPFAVRGRQVPPGTNSTSNHVQWHHSNHEYRSVGAGEANPWSKLTERNESHERLCEGFPSFPGSVANTCSGHVIAGIPSPESVLKGENYLFPEFDLRQERAFQTQLVLSSFSSLLFVCISSLD